MINGEGGEDLAGFLWALALFLVLIVILPGRAGIALGVLVALGAALFSPGLPEFVETVIRGGRGE